MALPPLDRLLGRSPESVEQLLNYGYRAAWKVRVGQDLFAVKADIRPGFQQREADAHRYAATSGVPVPEIVSVDDGPPATVVIRWVVGASLQGQDSAAAWRAAGRVLRLIHALPPLRTHEQRWDDFVLDWFAGALPYLARHGLGDGEITAALERANGLRTTLRAEPQVWLHGDCQADHFILDPASEQVVAVLDWADAQQGAAGMDFAVLTLFDDGVLPHVLDGYEASADFRQRLAATLPFYSAVRAASAAAWLDTHGYDRGEWPVEVVHRFARGD
ncbi:MAG TPA: aminoglycoside phosphotransferase family protein [Tepidiformaceae bacterium]